MGQKQVGGCYAPFGREELGPHLTQCGLSRGLYLHTKWHLHPSSRVATTDMGRKLEGAVPLSGEWGWVFIQHNVAWDNSTPYQVTS